MVLHRHFDLKQTTPPPKKSMFPVAYSKTAMNDAFFFFFFHFMDIKKQCAIFNINTTERNAHKNNAICRGPILFDIHFPNIGQKWPQTFDLPNKNNFGTSFFFFFFLVFVFSF